MRAPKARALVNGSSMVDVSEKGCDPNHPLRLWGVHLKCVVALVGGSLSEVVVSVLVSILVSAV